MSFSPGDQVYYYNGAACDDWYKKNDKIIVQNGNYMDSGDCMIDTCHAKSLDGRPADDRCSQYPGTPYWYQSFANSFVKDCNNPVPGTCNNSKGSSSMACKQKY
jgi:hypothetical protein